MCIFRVWLIIAIGTLSIVSISAKESAPVQVNARKRIRAADDTNQWVAVTNSVLLHPRGTALVICDMWDQHWCKGASSRVAEMAPRMNALVNAARDKGIFIIHCPSETMKFYSNSAARKLAQSARPVTPKVALQRWCRIDTNREALLPIDDSDGGCDDSPICKTHFPWTRQIDTIEIKDGDAVTDSAEAYYLMNERGITNVMVMGVHLNMCVLGRPFSIRQMVNQDQNVFLVRDMTDTMYNSRRRPYVNHFVGTDLMIEHVEKYWCPSITSVDFIGEELFRFKEDRRPTVAFLIGEDEYHTAETLPAFARQDLEARGLKPVFIHSDKTDPNQFPGLENLGQADLLVLSVRRRAPSSQAMKVIRDYVKSGKPVVGIRTASHAFGAKQVPPGHEKWDTVDVDLFGAKYQNHYGKGSATLGVIPPNAREHPILTGIETNALRFSSHLYRNRETAPTVTTLLLGQLEGKPDTEPLAWTNTNGNRKVFYTSLGSPEDFQNPAFQRLLLNGILWSLGEPIPPAAYALQARKN